MVKRNFARIDHRQITAEAALAIVLGVASVLFSLPALVTYGVVALVAFLHYPTKAILQLRATAFQSVLPRVTTQDPVDSWLTPRRTRAESGVSVVFSTPGSARLVLPDGLMSFSTRYRDALRSNPTQPPLSLTDEQASTLASAITWNRPNTDPMDMSPYDWKKWFEALISGNAVLSDLPELTTPALAELFVTLHRERFDPTSLSTLALFVVFERVFGVAAEPDVLPDGDDRQRSQASEAVAQSVTRVARLAAELQELAGELHAEHEPGTKPFRS